MNVWALKSLVLPAKIFSPTREKGFSRERLLLALPAKTPADRNNWKQLAEITRIFINA
jgi:hypothetical protein